MKNFKELFANLDLKRPFLQLNGTDISYGTFFEDVSKIASIPKEFELEQGSRILVSLENELELIKTTIGLISSGMTVVLIDPESKGNRIESILKAAKISGWIVDKENATRWYLPKENFNVAIEDAPKNSGVVSKLLMKKKDTNEKLTFQRWLDSLKKVESFPEISDNTQALILFTSGSTENPKGVPLSHKNILCHLETLRNQYELDLNSSILNVLPIYHVDGFIQGPLLSIFSNAKLVRPIKFEVSKIEDLLYSIYKYQISHFFVVPTMLQLLLKFGTSHSDAFKTEDFKYLISSAGPLDATLWMNFVEFFNVNIINVYGLTESVAGGLFHKPEDGKCRAGSIGRPIDLDARIITETGEDVMDDQVGELLLKGDNIMDSYLTPGENPSEEGWFHTGDLVSKDHDGYYYIKGRKKNVIIRGGVNIYAEELIEIINRHPQVSESFAVGISDEIWGEILVGVVVAQKGISEEDILTHLKSTTEPRNIPDLVLLVDEIPKGDSGKIASQEVRKLVNSAISKSNNEEDSNTEDIKSTILKLASHCFTYEVTIEQYHANSLKIEGWNSLAHLQLATLLEKHFDIKLSVKDIMNITCLSDAERIVQDNLGK